MAVVIPAALAVAGAIAKAANESSVNRRQKNDYLEGLRQQQASRDQARGVVGDVTSNLAVSNPEGYRAADNQNFLSQLQAHAGGIHDIPTVAGANSRYALDSARAGAATDSYGTTLAGLLSRLDSPAQQRAAEGYRAAHASSKLNQIGNFAEGNAAQAELKSQSERPNMWLTMLGGALTNAAAAYPTKKPAGTPDGTPMAGGPEWGGTAGQNPNEALA